ncbi:MAG: metal-dependent hydrolase [Candidatus Cloacimonadia bacterium]
MRLQYLSHSCFMINTDANQTILIDPFLDDNPNAPLKSKDVSADFIVVTHAHGDHLGDTLKIADKEKTTIICVNELAEYFNSKGYKAHNMHIGGSYDFVFGRAKLTIAHHSSFTPEGECMGPAAGVVLTIEGKNLYHPGDTGIFYDMKLIGEMNPLDYMFVPIGDNYTMGIEDGVKAVELANPKVAIPMHYDTFPVIKADPSLFCTKVREIGKKCIVMKYGEEITI